MSQDQLEAAAQPWAEQVARRYAAAAVPAISEGGQSILINYLTHQLAAVVHLLPIGDWRDRVNAALDEWEAQARTTGPRVEAFEYADGSISIRMRANTQKR